MSLFVYDRCTDIWMIASKLNKIALEHPQHTVKHWQVVPEVGLGPKNFYVIVELILREKQQ